MKNLKLSLIDNDYAMQAHADLNLRDTPGNSFLEFIEHLKEELVTGKTAYFEIEGAGNEPLVFSISQPE